MSEKIDHDQMFKTLIKTFFKDFVEIFLPGKAKTLDFNAVEFLESEYFTDLARGRRKRLDLIARVRTKSGNFENILIHIEFEARKGVPKAVLKRIFHYYCQLQLRHDEPIIPVVLFTDDHKWRKPVPDHYAVTYEGDTYVSFKYHRIKLKHYNWRDFLKFDNPLAYALMCKMDFDKKQSVQLKADFLRWALRAEKTPARKSLLFEFVNTYMKLEQKEEKEFERITIKKKTFKEVTKMITTYEKRGAIKSAREDVLEVVKLRFSDAPYALLEKIKYCDDLKKLKRLHKQAVLAKSIDELAL